MNRSDASELLELMELFISGSNQSRRLADEIEGIVIECFADEPWFEEVSTALAQFVPAGGEHYHDAQALSRELEPVARALRAFLSDS